MKKFFALMLVVAMLSVAGTAMAVTGSASPATVNMTVGRVATSTVTGVAANEGTLSYTLSSSAPAWVTLKGNVVTFRPTTTANTSVVVTVTETYTTETDAGHSTATATADVTIRVNVSPVEPEPEPEPEPQETTTVVERVKPVVVDRRPITVVIISGTARRAASVLNFAQTVRSVAAAIADRELLNNIGLSQALIQLWAEGAAQVGQFVQAAINSAAKRAVLFPGLGDNVDTTPQDNDQLEEVPGSTNDDADAGTKLAAATERLGRGSGRRALSAGGAVRPKKAGTYSFAKNFGPDLWNLPIQGDKGMMAGAVNAFSAADVDSTGVAFVDSQGNATTVIPGDENSKDIMPGFVTMLLVMEAGQVYEPVIFTTDSALEEKGITTESQDATVNVVDYSKKETVVVDADGKEKVQEDAPADALAKMTSALGLSAAPTRVPESALTSATAIKPADAKADKDYAASHDMFIATTYPAVGALTDGTYYAPVTFRKLDSGKTLAASADFEFYPDGLGASAEKAYVAVFTASGDPVTTPSDILSKDGYIVFAVESEVFRPAAAKDNEMDRPTVTLALKPASGPDSGDQPAVEDAVFNNLVQQEFIDATTHQLTDKAFGGSKPTLTIAADGTYTATVSLMFDVSSWTLAVAENGSVTKQFTSSTIGTGSLTPTSSTTAKITLDPSEITFGERAVTLTVTPKGATHTASASLGNVIGTKIDGDPTNVLGSSGGGCSAGSAVLALALLGSFILTRKK